MCSANHILTHSCSASLILTHSSKSNANIVLYIGSSRNSSHQNTPIKPHMYHYIEACVGNFRGSNQIYSSASRMFRIMLNTPLHQISYINIRTILILLSPEIDNLVTKSEGLSSVPTLPHLHSYFYSHHRKSGMRWNWFSFWAWNPGGWHLSPLTDYHNR